MLADIAEEAGRRILPLWRADLRVESKADSSPVTEADRLAETLILERLAASFPEIPVVSEEYASAHGAPERIGARFFLVDPLDGTKAFIRQDPNFTVNIALVVDGAPVAGAVVAPASGESWFTVQGGAAKRRVGEALSAPVRVRPAGGDPLTLISHTMKPETLEALKAQYGFTRTLALDSSIKLCRIAEGEADLYPRHGPTMEWDIAAAQAVLEAAGGTVLTLDGAPLRYGKADQGFRNPGFVARGRS
jgi:3'(2'), 5'-bisphosphate nucleotidase